MPGTALATVVRLERRGETAIIRIDNPPINAGSIAVRKGLLAAIAELDQDASLTGAVLIGADKMFMAGSDMREIHSPVLDPPLPLVISAIEDCPKPIVAAIAGAALGGGYELSLGCDARIAAPGAVVGLPECLLGMMPGAGGTQRLPRLVGFAAAIEVICAGTRVEATKAAAMGMIDAVADGDLLTSAIAYLQRMGGQKRRVIELPVPELDEAALATVEAGALVAGNGRPHIRLAIESTKRAARMPAAEALAIEREVFNKLRTGPETAAMLHLFFAEQGATRIADLVGIAPRPVETVAILGGAEAAFGLAAALVAGQKSVVIVETSAASAEAARAYAAGTGQSPDRLDVATDPGRLVAADAIIVFRSEDEAARLATLAKIARPGALLLMTGSSAPIADLARQSGRAGDVAGLHFPGAPGQMRLVEIVRHADSAPESLATALALAKAMRKIAVLVQDSSGLIGDRLVAAAQRERHAILDGEATPEDVYMALEAFGFRGGPLTSVDHRASTDPSRTLDGSGHGRVLPAETIVQRILAALANEAAILIEDDIVNSAGDIDLVLTKALGFPEHEGGLLFWIRSQPVAELEAMFKQVVETGRDGARTGSLEVLRAAATAA